MQNTGPRLSAAALALAFVVVTAQAGLAAPHPSSTSAAVSGTNVGQLAQADGESPRELQPRYEPVPAAPSGQGSSFNDEYIFGLTRGIADSALHPAAKILLFPMTVPLDIALLPFEIIGGFF
jgi:hypothetical protein